MPDTSDIAVERRSAMSAEFIMKVKSRECLVGIIGLGYVGLPLAYTFLQKGFRVVGFDVDQSKVGALSEGRSYMRHFSNDKVAGMSATGRFEATTDLERLGEADAILICVPTPLSVHREPDLSFVVKTTEQIAKRLRRGQLVVLESTTYPGTSDEVMKPLLEQISGLSADRDFGIAYSPEREDPGNPNYDTETIPKIVGAESADARAMALALYSAAVKQVVPVSDARTAEAVKLTENIFRLVNIGLVNELKVIFESMNIDVWEVIDAAKTKPFGFMAFYPGPGVGGHCIPIDPFYLTWKARADGNPTRFIELAGEIVTQMPRRVIESVANALSERRQQSLKGANILLLGIAYKADIDDMRESPAMPIWQMLCKKGASVVYHDPFVPEVLQHGEHDDFVGEKSVRLTPEMLQNVDAVLITTHHSIVDYRLIIENAPLIIDTRNVTAPFMAEFAHKIIKA
jgi:UDP-N-acetyl-D-glucosamine dehydrogenase